MLFNSFTFLVFFSIVFIAHYTLPHKFRWIMLLIASLVFYMWWKAELIILIVFSTLSNFLLSSAIFNTEEHEKRKIYLILSLIINFSLLFVFKYLVFATNSFLALTGKPGLENFNIILPMGISFYTFQAAAYTIDVYRKTIKPERNYFKFLLFITFFPQLVAGPIERAKHLLPQLFTRKRLLLDNVTIGFKIALLGFFKKIIIADRAAILVNGVFNSVEYYGFVAYVISALLFSFQIYCDFSGYSDIAVGCSRMLGIDIMRNFNHPYLSFNFKDFWRRWHISLSTWFKDYLYFPLGGSRVSRARHYLNLMITFTVSGLWHGANWTFVLWGLLNGLFQIIGDIKSKFTKPFEKRNPISKLISIIITFGLTCMLFTIFRANTISDVKFLFTHFFWGFREALTAQGFYSAISALPITLFELIVVLAAIIFLMIVEIIEKNDSIHNILDRKPVVLKFAFYFLVLTALFSLGVFSSGEDFIYFQF